jgi:SAM-dependent methyltransferase
VPVVDYWREQYTDDEFFRHHSLQNQRIANSFLRAVERRPLFIQALRSSRQMIEIGCGTGEFAMKIKGEFDPDVYYATDLSSDVVKKNQKRIPWVNFWVYDILEDEAFSTFDLLLCSNVLEHFKIPHTVINKMFHFAPQLILLVPYKQPLSDGYDSEGGPGHVYSFDEESFKQYSLVDSFTFTSQGWQWQTNEEKPLQLAVLIREKN